MIITPAAIGTVPSVMVTRPSAGWRNNRRACCPARTIWSPYLAGRVAPTGLCEPEKGLWLAAALCRRRLAETGAGSALRWGTTGCPGRAAYLDQGDALSPARPSAGDGRRPLTRRQRVAGCEPGLLNA